MNLEPNNKSLSFAEFLDAATRDKAEAKPFPYTLEVCRCRYCSFCQNGKCALKRCCCMNERVKARSCTFAELLRDCFANFKDNVFQFRLRIACERATELHTCFLDAGHRARFYEGVSYMRKKDPKFIAQLYLLSASELLWIRAKQVMCSPGFIDYSCLDLKLTEPKAEFAVILKSLANAGICIVIVSHDIEFCAQYADRCALFFDGSIVAEGAPDEFFCGNSFYTTSANRIAKEIIPNAVTTGDVIEAIGGESKELFPTDAAEYRRQERTEEKPAEPSPLPLWQKIGAWIPGLVVLLHVYLCDQD